MLSLAGVAKEGARQSVRMLCHANGTDEARGDEFEGNLVS